MQITNPVISYYPKLFTPSPKFPYSKFRPLACDTVSFGATAQAQEPRSIIPEESYEHLYNLCLNKHRAFFENAEPKDAKEYLDYIFSRHDEAINSLAELCDKELNSILVDKGIGDLIRYLKTIHSFKKNNCFELLKGALNCTNPDGSKLRQNQKLQLVDLMNVYKTIHQSPSQLRQMVNDGSVDILKLQRAVVDSILEYAGDYDKSEFSEIPQDKLDLWDLGYTYLLALSCKKRKIDFEDIVRYANLPGDFKTQINDINNPLGKNNTENKRLFEANGLNYDKWLTPPSKINVELKLNDNDVNGLNEIAEGVNETVAMLRFRPAVKKIIDKNYKSFIRDGYFVLPQEVYSNKSEFLKFLIKFDNDMKSVWNRAEKNLNSSNEELQGYAKVTMRMSEHISEYIKIVQNYNPKQNLDLTIKMWDRVPQKDLFQGNYSTCCIGMGRANAEFMPTYLLNTAFNMVEMIDNSTGKTVGNSLCYYMLNEDKKPILVFDNVEINNSLNNNLSFDMLKQIRAALAEYAQNLNNELSENEIPVYVGDANNDIPVLDLEPVQLNDVEFLGEADKYESIYSDVFGGCVTKSVFRGDADLRVLKNK